MNETIKRIATAICIENNPNIPSNELVCIGMPQLFNKGYIPTEKKYEIWTFYIEDAIAAIKAMREPTDEQRNNYYKLSFATETFVDATWERSIDAILMDKK